MFWSLDPSSRPEIIRPIHNFFQNFNDSEHIAVSAPKKNTRLQWDRFSKHRDWDKRWVQMTEHVAKFSVIWLSLLADADEASPAIFLGGLDLTWAIRISIRCPLPAPAHVSQMNYIAKTSRSPHQKLLSKRCLNIAKKAMRSKSWGPWQTQQVSRGNGVRRGEMQKCFLRSDETNYVLIAFLDRWCTHSSGIFRLGRVLEWIAGPKTWARNCPLWKDPILGAAAPSVVHLLPCGTDMKLVALRSDKFTFENTLLHAQVAR